MTSTSVVLVCFCLSAYACVVSSRSAVPTPRRVLEEVTSDAQSGEASSGSSPGDAKRVQLEDIADCNVIPLRLCSENDASALCGSVGLIRRAICERAGVDARLLSAANETFKKGVRDGEVCSDSRFGISEEMGQLLPEPVERFIKANGSRCKDICTVDGLFVDLKCKAFHAALLSFVSIVDLTAAGGVVQGKQPGGQKEIENSQVTTGKENATAGEVRMPVNATGGVKKNVSDAEVKTNVSTTTQPALVNVTKAVEKDLVEKPVKSQSLPSSTVKTVLSTEKGPAVPTPLAAEPTKVSLKVAQTTKRAKVTTQLNEPTEESPQSGDRFGEDYDLDNEGQEPLDDRANYPSPDADGDDAAQNVGDSKKQAEKVEEDKPKPKVKQEAFARPEQEFAGSRYGFDGRRRSEVEAESNFVTYLGMLIVGGGIVYLAFINRHKVLALLVEGSRSRTSSERRRTGSGAKYHKLDNLEDTLRRTHDKESDDKHVVF